MNKKWRKLFAMGLLLGFMILGFIRQPVATPTTTRMAPSPTTRVIPSPVPTPTPTPPLRVLIIGGSAAKGWKDATGQGYVVRGLNVWAQKDHLQLQIDNQAIPGSTINNPALVQGYPQWLANDQPNVVVIAWGMLNDLRLGTPEATLLAKLHADIAAALNAHAKVFVVTPIPTLATMSWDRTTELKAIADEIQMANAFHCSNVQVFNILPQMEQELNAQHIPVSSIMDGKWDPNTLGHTIGGEILGKDLIAHAAP